jgi:hypothetical protein
MNPQTPLYAKEKLTALKKHQGVPSVGNSIKQGKQGERFSFQQPSS